MTNIKDVIQIALNVGFAVPRYVVDTVILNKNYELEVTYYDNLFGRMDSCTFSL